VLIVASDFVQSWRTQRYSLARP